MLVIARARGNPVLNAEHMTLKKRGLTVKNKFSRSFAMFIIMAAAFFIPALSFAEDASEVVAKLQRKYDSITSIKAAFTQEVSSKGMPATSSRGNVWLKKPGKMRWEYQEPAKDIIVSDGKTIWLYQPDLNQAIKSPASSGASSMATDFLSGIGKIEKEFIVILSSAEGQYHVLTLTPKSEQPSLKKLVLEVGKYSYLVEKTVITDHFGNQTSVSFTDITLNSQIKDSLFKYAPPRGAAIIKP